MRIDKILTDKYGSRTKAARAIADGEVLVNGREVDASYNLKDTDLVSFCDKRTKYVSVGGYKLEKALDDFAIDVTGWTLVDIGASTGGFTDCLLKRGAEKVYCVDVGSNQLDSTLLDRNVVVIDNFNARNLGELRFDETINGIVADVSFISLTYLLEGVCSCLGDGGVFIGLIKPQFELDRNKVGKNGIVKGVEFHRLAIARVYECAVGLNFSPVAVTTAPIVAGKNMEYPMLFKKAAQSSSLDSLLRSVAL